MTVSSPSFLLADPQPTAPDRTCYFEPQYLDQWCAEPDFYYYYSLRRIKDNTNHYQTRWTNIELIQNRATNTTDHADGLKNRKINQNRSRSASSFNTSWFCFVNIYSHFFCVFPFSPDHITRDSVSASARAKYPPRPILLWPGHKPVPRRQRDQLLAGESSAISSHMHSGH